MRLHSYRTPHIPFTFVDRMLDGRMLDGRMLDGRMLDDRARPVADVGGEPGYDLVETGEGHYRIELPVPGFAEADLDIRVEDRMLVVRGRAPARPEGETLVRQGVVRGDFERRFTLGEHIQVGAATLEHGVLRIELAREVPEALRPRTIRVGRAN
mgnify:FL=1